MKKIRLWLVLLMVFCVCAGFTITADAEDTVTLPVTIEEDWGLAASLVTYINDQRTADGKNAYVMDSGLMQVAMDRVAELCVYYHHNSALGDLDTAVYKRLDNTVLAGQIVSEDIAVGLEDAASVYRVWVNSQTHVGALKSTKVTVKLYALFFRTIYGKL